MNYKHIFHAGSFADVFKHSILLALVKAFFNKDKPISYLETHAGSGCYQLNSMQAQKTQEYQRGIIRLLTVKDPLPIIAEYLKIIYSLNGITDFTTTPLLERYPGSPYFVKKILRRHDKMMLCELHPNEYQGLKDFMGHEKNVAIHHSDGYSALNALLPPNPRRGLVFIDPPFEKEDELARLQAGLQVALTKWPEGTYAIWYPIKNNDQHVQLLKIIDSFAVNTVKAEMIINEDPTSTKLIGTGMVILNPPWQFELQLQKLVPWLWTYLSDDGEGHYLTTSN